MHLGQKSNRATSEILHDVPVIKRRHFLAEDQVFANDCKVAVLPSDFSQRLRSAKALPEMSTGPEVAGIAFSTLTPLLFQNLSICVRQFSTSVQTPATVIDSTETYPCFYLRNDHIASCYRRN